MGEVVVSGSLLILQMEFIRKIFKLIKESDLDLIPVSRTFCANLSVVGFLFLVQCGDLGLSIITAIFMDKSKKEQEESGSTGFIILALVTEVCLFLAYFSFFLLIYRSTESGKPYECLILHQEVPELVYLSTRKMLRDLHFKRAEQRRTVRDDDEVNDAFAQFDAKEQASATMNPNLQSMRSDTDKVELMNDGKARRQSFDEKKYASSNTRDQANLLDSETPYNRLEDQPP